MRVSWARLGAAHEGLLPLLDAVERRRHDTIVDPATRDRFLLGCALSRLRLGERLDVPPADVPLRRECPHCGGPHGKPRLAVPSPYAFSVTHSGGLVGVAVCRGAEVGLDLEEADAPLDVDAAARTALAAPELTALYARPSAGRQAAFLRVWTRKEAVLKALGVGLRVPLRELRVSAPEEPPAVLSWPRQLTARPGVGMADLLVDGTHPASVAVTGARGVDVTCDDGTAALAAYVP
ncbi:4'-phosphopantetheinyl transferase superfamily protein [Streptomyces sp. NPDC002588]|uniref:4'-phosphopantetheinyl transferase family protein n=1 Tax=Streptomyces sp. NPDC002588 TaxID=3154419 RepID=UPI0033183DB9